MKRDIRKHHIKPPCDLVMMGRALVIPESVVCYVLASVFGIWLLISIFRSGKL